MILTKSYAPSGTLNNIIDELFSSSSYNWVKQKNSNSSSPAVNIYESQEGYHLEMNVPGRTKEDFTINIENALLTIGYSHKEGTEKPEIKTVRQEFAYNSFKRSFSLDEKVNAEGINARYENGILKLFIPKKAEVVVTPKQIQIQ